ncbi:putative integral membrane protein [Acanthocheilonema viteae]
MGRECHFHHLFHFPILTIGKLWIVIAVVYLLNTIEPGDGQSPFKKPKKRRYKLIPFYDGEIKIGDPNKPALIRDLLLLSHVLNDTANTIFGSKDIARDLLTFFVNLDQIMVLAAFLCLKRKET